MPPNWASRDASVSLARATTSRSLLAASDVFALTSHNEANPVSILEAMSVGKPVVATNVGSIHEAVTDGRNGFLVPPGDAAAFADRVIELLEDPLRAKRWAPRPARPSIASWSIDAMVRRYERLIASIYHRKRPPPVGTAAPERACIRDYVDAEWRSTRALAGRSEPPRP